MINVKKNFKTMFSDTSCNLGDCNEPQTQNHLLYCSAIIENCSELRNGTQVIHSDLFADVEKQRRCAQLYSKILQIKEQLDEASQP